MARHRTGRTQPLNSVRKFGEDAAIGVGVAERPEDLDVFFAPGVAAAIWQRRPKSGFKRWIEMLDPKQLPCCRLILAPNDVTCAVTEVCEDAGMPSDDWRGSLVADITVLAEIFAGMMRAKFLRLRLDVVTSDACRKFHIDAVTARLVCTYRGTGTQYGISNEGTEPSPVFTTPTGSPLFLRGSLWPTPPRSGLLHRSPPYCRFRRNPSRACPRPRGVA